MEKNSFTIAYDSGIAIWDKSMLSTLSVFFDRLFLPYTDISNPNLLSLRKTGLLGSDFIFDGSNIYLKKAPTHNGKLMKSDDVLADWEESNKVLFQEGVIERLEPPASKTNIKFGQSIKEQSHISDIILDIPEWQTHVFLTKKTFYIWADQIYHILRDDIILPRIFVTRNRYADREVLTSLLAHSTFSYLFPKLGELKPEEIIEVRQEVKDTREGFAMHVQNLTSEIDERLEGGESLKEIKRYAKNIAETKFIPGYREYRRQLEAKKAGFWGKVLDKASKIAEIDAAPWTPKFYAELAKALGMTILAGYAEREKQLSNRSQAYHFLKTIEKKYFNLEK